MAARDIRLKNLMPLFVVNTNSMAYKIVITSLAHLDEFEAYEWYEQRYISQ